MPKSSLQPFICILKISPTFHRLKSALETEVRPPKAMLFKARSSRHQEKVQKRPNPRQSPLAVWARGSLADRSGLWRTWVLWTTTTGLRTSVTRVTQTPAKMKASVWMWRAWQAAGKLCSWGGRCWVNGSCLRGSAVGGFPWFCKGGSLDLQRAEESWSSLVLCFLPCISLHLGRCWHLECSRNFWLYHCS